MRARETRRCRPARIRSAGADCRGPERDFDEDGEPEPEQVPQVWALYKEVQGYYEKGMRVPDDVTLLWSDDNWAICGGCRRRMNGSDRAEPGSITTSITWAARDVQVAEHESIPKVQEQMHLALEYGADRLWVVNVGDGKPMEFPIEFFLDYARRRGAGTRTTWTSLRSFAAAREFGPEHADEIATAMEDYTRYNGRRKPERSIRRLSVLANYGEADRVEAEWRTLPNAWTAGDELRKMRGRAT